MLSVMSIEWKKCGVNITWITATVLIAFIILCAMGGDLVNWPLLGFEVILPFLIAILACEFTQTLSDPMIDIVIVHSKSLFKWVLGRFLVVVGLSGTLCLICMLGLRLCIFDFSLIEMLFIFIVTTYFFTSIGVFSSFLSKQPHIPAAICGIIWLLTLMVKSMIRYPVVAYLYPLLRFVDPDTEIWLTNKMILLAISICLWLSIYFVCRKRRIIS
jgi:hypothetical protein